VTFRVAGGDDGRTKVTVFGMPTFRVGKRYVVFLVPRFERTAAPVVGVYQGYFEVIRQGAGRDVLLDNKGDVVVGIEQNRIQVRRGAAPAEATGPQLAPAPVPQDGSDARIRTTSGVERYLRSEDAGLSLDALIAAVRAVKEAKP